MVLCERACLVGRKAYDRSMGGKLHVGDAVNSFGINPGANGYHEPSGLLQGRPIHIEKGEGGRPLDFAAIRRDGLEIGRRQAG